MSAEQDITVKYKYTEQEMMDALAYHFQRRLVFVLWPRVFGVGLIAWAMWQMFSDGVDFWSLLPLWICGIGMFFLTPLQKWRTRKRFAKRPDKDMQIEWHVSATEIRSKSDKGTEFKAPWELVYEVIESSKGFLIYPHQGIFYWLPISGFVEPSQVDSFRNLVTEKKIKFKRAI